MEMDAQSEAYSVEIHPDRESWLVARRTGIGGSDAPAVVGARPSPLAVFADKLELAEPVVETPAMRWGRTREPLVAQAFAAETGAKVEDPGPFTIHRSRERPWLFASLDRVIVGDARGPGVLECKTTGAIHREAWRDEPPLAYQVQVQHALAATGFQWGALAVLVGGSDFIWTEVPRNERFIEILLTIEARFWARVQAQEPPPPSGSDVDLLRALYPTSAETTIALPAAATDWDAEREQAVAEIKRWTELKQAAEAKFMAAMQDAAAAVLPNGIKYTWRTSERHIKAQPARTDTVRIFRRSNG